MEFNLNLVSTRATCPGIRLVDYDVTAWVQEWLFDTSPNYGIWIGTNATGLDWFQIYTKENSGTVSNPQLILYYTEYVADSDASGEI